MCNDIDNITNLGTNYVQDLYTEKVQNIAKKN